ncbi:hypothetical protein ACFO25_15865 [Paenactinomyces guangxiensis]|uniref:Uncharacterized protein n=1 Tax=Paenactinomyces guangxiensis TaxID=1490290 RepID=A0A7W1WUK9_9BACL|nr:hypothetical protein [Paenactinomyces guangxiensis]MBA4496365.1 hypothetical protein [Paenactinomyces guangxiensis]MBH8593602.1 hypothetical protein [Paenactinomyces guangxiensis]
MKLSTVKKGGYFLLFVLISIGVVSYIYHLKPQKIAQELKLEQLKNEIAKDNVANLDAYYVGGSQAQVTGELKAPAGKDFMTLTDVTDMGDLEDLAVKKGMDFQFSYERPPRPLYKIVTPIVLLLLITISGLFFWKKWREA